MRCQKCHYLRDEYQQDNFLRNDLRQDNYPVNNQDNRRRYIMNSNGQDSSPSAMSQNVYYPMGQNNTAANNYRRQFHVHEVQGSVMLAEPQDPHNHRFATVSGEAIRIPGCDHVHDVYLRTDFYDGHYHEFYGRSSGAIWVGDRHVHFLEAATSENDGHYHEFRVATLIDDPIGE